MDESHERWINEAREHGLPVALTGFVLFRIELGLPPWSIAVLALLMVLGLVCAARATFAPPDPGY